MDSPGPQFRLEDLDRLMRDSERSIRDLTAAMDRLATITAAGESRTGMVRALVDAQGRLSEVTINPRAMRQDSEALAEEVVQAVQAAQDDLQRQADELVAPLATEELGVEAAQRRFGELTDSFARETRERIARMEDIRRRDHWDG